MARSLLRGGAALIDAPEVTLVDRAGGRHVLAPNASALRRAEVYRDRG